jgi:hypothetical protein
MVDIINRIWFNTSSVKQLNDSECKRMEMLNLGLQSTPSKVEQANINGEMKMQTTPFKRALAMMALIQAQMALPAFLRDMDSIGTYKSRGKGKNKSKPSKNYFTSNSKYSPHQNSRECARRVSQMATA